MEEDWGKTILCIPIIPNIILNYTKKKEGQLS